MPGRPPAVSESQADSSPVLLFADTPWLRGHCSIREYVRTRHSEHSNNACESFGLRGRHRRSVSQPLNLPDFI